ncbi:MAG: HEPN domain-containing protein, partial [Bacteroidota bacterium]
ITGLLVKAGIETKTHTGVKTQFFLHFVKTGKISMSLGKLYTDLFDWRQKGDYGDFFDFTEADVAPFLEPIKQLIDAVIEEINKTK